MHIDRRAAEGIRVLVLASSQSPLTGDSLPPDVQAVAMLMLGDRAIGAADVSGDQAIDLPLAITLATPSDDGLFDGGPPSDPIADLAADPDEIGRILHQLATQRRPS